jgi:maltoporin
MVTLLSLLTIPSLLAQQSADRNDAADVTALKAQMEKMQKQYEDRISAMESKMQSLESKAEESGSILNTHVLTDADGKQYEGKGPVLDESFLKSLTRNFSFSAYVRAGVQFNGSGGGGNFHFEAPDNPGGRARLGNENDTYMELTWKQAHMLGDNPDVMDVSMVFTPAIRYVQNRASFVTGLTGGRENGNDFDFILREAYLEMANVFRSASEITFWGGIRFYDRFNFDPQDFFWLDTSGYGAGVEKIDVGIGKLWLAYLGGLDDDINSPNTGSFYKHNLDARLKDIQIGPGKLMLVGLATYEKGSTFTRDFAGAALRNPIRTDDAYGLGGGAVYQFDLSFLGPKSYLQLFALGGFGSVNFRNSGTDVSTITGFQSNFLIQHPATPAGVVINAGEAIQRMRQFEAGAMFVWNPNPCFSIALWGLWNQDSNGFRLEETFTNPFHPVQANGVTPNLVFKNAPATRNMWQVGIRPVVWLADNIAIQAQAYGVWGDNVRGFQTNNYPTFGGTNGLPIPHPGTLSPTAFSRSGEQGVFTIAPTIKPKGGFFSRPELRVFATYSIWSNSWKGATTPIQEGGNTNGFTPSPYANPHSNQGWLIGTQVEWYL